MPYQTRWVEPDRFLEHHGVIVFHTYKDDDVDQGTKRFHFTVNTACTLYDDLCDAQECHHVFDVHDLSTWREPVRPPYCLGSHDTSENHAAWDRHWEAEQEAIRSAIIAAIERGELTASGHQPAAQPQGQPVPASQ